jgi:deoxyribodipyrimidine photolyase-like uncharacterized protein
MPEYAEMNALQADLPMPAFMWTAEIEMSCIHICIQQLIDQAYAHHIQRLMVMGLFSLLLGVRPYDVHRWHLSMYADAVDWVSLPNVLGMSQCGDILEAAPGIEPGDKGFAILCLTTWLCRHVESITYLNTKDNIDK